MNKIASTLLVDDDSINNFINQRLIEDLGVTHHLALANNGLEALEYLKNNCQEAAICPALILLDINMPVMDGFEFLQEFQTMQFFNKDKIRIVVLTTSTSQKDAQKLQEFPIDGFINKPLTEEKILELVKEFF